MAAPVQPSLSGSPTESGIIGKYTNASHLDIFQTYDSNGSLLAAMNYQGIVYSGASGLFASVVPLIANVVINSAQLKALHATKVTIIPAPGQGLILYPQSFFCQYDYGTQTYSGASTNFYLGYGGQSSITSSTAVGFFPTAGFIDQTSSQVFINSSYYTGAAGIPLSQALNQPLVLTTPDTLITGDGSLTINISYALLPQL